MEKVVKVSNTEYQIIFYEPSYTISFRMNKEIKKSLEDKYKNFSELIRKSLAEEIEYIKDSDLIALAKLKGNQVVTFRLKESELQKLDEEAKRLKATRTDIILLKLAKVINNEIQQ